MPRQNTLSVARQDEQSEVMCRCRRAIHHGEPIVCADRERFGQGHDLLAGILALRHDAAVQ